MSIDITQLQSQGASIWEAQLVNYDSNPRNAFRYKIKFLSMNYSDEIRTLTGSFRVLRFVLQNNEWTNDLSYIYDSVADDSTWVDKYGNIVEENDPEKWGTEFERMQYLFNADLKDSIIVESYQQMLFDRGAFDFPKSKSL